MHHRVPDLPTVKDRSAYLVEKAKDKIVLDIGCTGKISEAIRKAAKEYHGFDRVAGEGIDSLELDHRPDLMPVYESVELIICSEFLEHLANPGYFLLALKERYPGKIAYFTVPNAGAYTVHDGCEIVNVEHVAWYSYQTLKTLLTRYNYEILASRWYHGPPFKAEGIIMEVRT
jgi:2-polyprenyl-3-methyl-5-hydroxy-6-metoxy-1,4-benzoquinol methylase